MNAIADRLEIIELLGKHQITIDLVDTDAYADLYTPDGRYESPFATARGREDIREMSMRLARAGFTEGKRHLIGPMIIEVDGDEARAFSYWWVAETKRHPESTPPAPIPTGSRRSTGSGRSLTASRR